MRDGGRVWTVSGRLWLCQLVDRRQLPVEGNRAVKGRHRQQQAGAAELVIYRARIINPVADILPRNVLIGPGPNIGGRNTPGGVAKPVVLLQLREKSADGPILVPRGMRLTIDQRVDRRVLPRFEGSPTSRDVHRNAIPGIALGEISSPVL